MNAEFPTGDVVRRPVAPRHSAGPAPLRRPGSIRRTSSIDTDWPGGRDGNLHMVGRARDAVTPPAGGPPIVLTQDEFRAELQWDRTVVAIEASPARTAISGLIGARGGGHLRGALDKVLPDERRSASPLHLILDDISGVSLVAGWAWSQWTDQWRSSIASAASASRPPRRSMEGVCMGFRPGSSALDGDAAFAENRNDTEVTDLRRPDDPEGWHEFTNQESVGMRRARRIDVWLDKVIRIDSAFQDSATNPRGGRTAIHEYRLTASADPKSLCLLSVEADPRVLPFPECPAAAANVGRLIGAPLDGLRERVLQELRGTAGCTHLNDALRALAEVPILVQRLEAAARSQEKRDRR